MLAPESPLSRKGRPLPRFNPRPYVAAADTLRPAQRYTSGAPWAWGTVLIAVPTCWAMTVVWAVERLF